MDDSTYEWRKQQLEKAGYTCAQAEVLADGTCDLHMACELITKHHAPPDIAFDILSDEVAA